MRLIRLKSAWLVLAAVWPLCAGAEPATGTPTPAPKPDLALFEAWRADFSLRAKAEGISDEILSAALGGLKPNEAVMAANDRQPEHARAVWDYIEGAASDTRIAKGQARLAEHAPVFAKATEAYGVPAETLAAIWGVESDFGANTGNYNVFEALATLAFTGRRQAYGEAQLLAALKIVARGDKPISRMTGSWAGAMGQTQFIPTTYLQYAVDADGDGRRDLFDSIPDVMASTANYLAASGWAKGERWGREVSVPPAFEFSLADPSVELPVKDWRGHGVKEMDGKPLPASDDLASLLVPAGHKGPAFLVQRNFRAILKYNNSTAYALAIGHLADRFAGSGPIKGAWPRSERPLTLSERMEMQSLLKALGYEIGEIDGIVGAQTRAGLKQYQRTKGLPADGFATVALLDAMRADAGVAAPPAPQPKAETGAAAVPAGEDTPGDGGMSPVRSPGDPG